MNSSNGDKLMLSNGFAIRLDKGIAKETLLILDMWRMIEASINNLTPDAQDRVRQSTHAPDKFGGFDADSDPHHGIARAILDLGKYREFRDRDLDSHSGANLMKYRRMMVVYRKHESEAVFCEKHLIEILNA